MVAGAKYALEGALANKNTAVMNWFIGSYFFNAGQMVMCASLDFDFNVR